VETAEILFHVGAGSLVFLGIAHTIAEVLGARRALPPELAGTIQAMKDTRVPMPGREVPLYDLMRGFSLMMGLLLVTLGVTDHLLAAVAIESAAALSVSIAFSAIGLAMSVRYFFIVPTALLAVATGCFIGAWVV
jgi:uncharacterized Tic20 family protein